MSGAQTEIELKLRVAPGDVSVLQNHPHFASVLHNPTRETLNSVYFDSDNHFLRDQGLTLRVRHIGDKRIQTIKTTSERFDWFERLEWEQAIEGDQPDLTRVADATLGPILTEDVRKALKPVFETRIERTAYHLNGNETDIFMAIDEGQVVTADSSCPVSEIELELKHGNAPELFKVARAISDVVPVQLDVKSKAERGYDLIDNRPAAIERAYNPKLSAGMTAGRAFTLIGRACLRHLVANVPATINRDTEAHHQMRVALRRLRAAISLFLDFVSDDRIDVINTELRWLAGEFGQARDLDTFIIETLWPMRRRHPDQPGLVSVGRMFARQRLKGYRRAQDAVQSARFRTLVLDTAEWVEAGPWSTSEDPLIRARSEMPIEIHAAEQLSRRRKRLRRKGAKIAKLSPAQLHSLRIQVKKTRYAAEFFSGTYSGRKSARRCKRILKSLGQLQNYLGGTNDIVTRKALFADIIASPSSRLTAEQNRHRAYAAGLIIGDQQAKIETLLDSARKAHFRFSRAKIFWRLPRVRANIPPPSATKQLELFSQKG